MSTHTPSPSMIPWSITFALLAIVTAAFAFGGTSTEYLSLSAQVLAAVFLGLAILVIFLKRGRPGAH